MSKPNKNPNVLILMSDEHRADLAGFAGDKIVRTPVLDKLAKEGVVFDNAYTPSPICVPARQCLMSGQLTKTCACDGSWVDLKPGYNTFSKRFSQYAYNTVCSGKLHHIGTDQMQGWTQRLAPDADVLPKYIDGLQKDEWLDFEEPALAGRKTNEGYIKEAGVNFGKFQYFDATACDAAKYYIRSYFGDSKDNNKATRPLMLKTSFLQPHYPFFTDKKRFDYYYDKVPIFKDKLSSHPVLSQSQIEEPIDVTEEEVRKATATYYAMIETIDTYYGEILDTLTECGQNIDDWIIVYLSDHGEMLGEHGIWEKARFYESSVKVPLIMRWPGKIDAGKRIDQNVNLCDLFSTLCDFSGISVPTGLDSRSLVPLINGTAKNWSNETVSQIKRNKIDHVMIKQDHLKYQYYGEEIEEVLFNLDKDPNELINLAKDEEYLNDMTKFRIRLAELGYGKNADKNYKNAGYKSGVEEIELGNKRLWKEDSNPWLEPIQK